MTRRPALVVAAGLAAAGLVLAVLLARVHVQAHAGVASFCSINDYVNCDRVAESRFSVVLGLPVAIWGVLGYGVALALALAGLSPRRRHAAWPAGLLVLLSVAFSAVAVVLAAISELAIGALCLLCAASWAVSFALLAASWRACRPGGVGAAVRDDLALLRARPGRTAALAVAGLALVLLAVQVYPRLWRAAVARSAAAARPPGSGTDRSTVGPPPVSDGPLVVVEFSDYECPFCAVAHAEAKQVLARRPDVRLVKRQFPLDSDCNPLLKRRMHPEACTLARAAICAGDQGKFEAMDDALFENQKAKLPLEDVAKGVGLDLEKLRLCMASPATAARLASDVEAGIRVGLRATPTYVIGGRPYDGKPLSELLPPPRTASAP
jgi:protein-disulfide isomerase